LCFFKFARLRSWRTWNAATLFCKHIDHFTSLATGENLLTYNDFVLCCSKVSHWNVRMTGPYNLRLVASSILRGDSNSVCGQIFYVNVARRRKRVACDRAVL